MNPDYLLDSHINLMQILDAVEEKAPDNGHMAPATSTVLPQKAADSQPSSSASRLSEDEVAQLTQELEVLKEQPRAQMVRHEHVLKFQENILFNCNNLPMTAFHVSYWAVSKVACIQCETHLQPCRLAVRIPYSAISCVAPGFMGFYDVV